MQYPTLRNATAAQNCEVVLFEASPGAHDVSLLILRRLCWSQSSGSEIHDAAPDLLKGLTSPAQAKQFVQESGVDTLAPAVGNMHGLLKSMVDGDTKKRLDIERIRAIKAATRIFMTLHGASGTDDNDLRQAIAAGMTVIHINTEVRIAWRHGFESALAKQPNEIVPYKLLPQVVDSVKQVVTTRLALFGGGQRVHPASA